MKILMVITIALLLSGCSTVTITYTITGDSNVFDTQGRVVSPKEISTAGSAYGDAASKGGR